MAFGHGISGKFFYNSMDMSDYVETVNADLERDVADIKTIGATAVSRLTGTRSVTVAIGGVYDAATTGIDVNIWDAFGNGTTGGDEHIFALCPQGDTAGNACYCGTSLANSFSVNDGAADAVKYPVGAIGSDRADRCGVLHALAARTTDASETAIDGTATSSAGGRGYLIASAVSGTVDVIIEDSTNGTSWATLVTFTQLAAVGEESISLTASATVNRYVRATWDVSVAGSATFFVAFGRNANPPSPSASVSPSVSPSLSPSASVSPSISPSVSPSASLSPSSSVSPSISPSAAP